APTASRDSAGVSLAGRSRRGGLGGRRRAKRPQSQAARGPGLADRRPSKPPPPPDRDADGVLDEVDALPEDFNGFEDEDGIPEPMESADPAEPDAPAEPIVDRLPPPKTTASALSIIVPAAGEAVLYQRQLLKPGEAYTIQLDARERRRFFRRLRRTR
ncbi:MAG: hypothetical protein KC468_38565, partial [Myxococcales bacterium]|nr:hypothetical protein [Myxococcales bacterium]